MDINQDNCINHLTQEQSNGLDVLINKQFIFVTGAAGSGKTALVNYYSKHYCDNKLVVKVAFTAACATNLPKDKDSDIVGTIHSVFKIKTSGVIKPKAKPEYESLKHIFNKYDVIIIDEISMVRIDMFEYLMKLLAKANKYRSSPIKLIFIGEFYQLPPIVTDSDKDILSKYYHTDDGYCFESDYWKQLPLSIVNLSTNIRSSDNEFNHYLNNIKEGKDLDNTLAFFNKQVRSDLTPSAGIVELYATNKLVDKINRLCLRQLPGKATTIPAYYDDEVLKDVKSKKLTNKNLPCLLSLKLKPNAQVMFTINDKIDNDNKQRFVNGDIATVISCDQQQVVVKLLKNDKLVHLHKYNCSYSLYKSNGDRYCGQFKQYPLRLAYAITIHKAQGKTFNKVHLDPSSDYDLNPGQVYVALSRVKSINDLYLYSPLKLKDISMNDKVVKFYKDIDPDRIKDKLFSM